MTKSLEPEQCKLSEKSCVPCEGGVPSLNTQQIETLLKDLPDWQHHKNSNNEDYIFRSFSFKNYHETMTFVNAVAKISHQEKHHPVMEVSYKDCLVKYQTYAINGLSENDFICAAKVNDIFEHFS